MQSSLSSPAASAWWSSLTEAQRFSLLRVHYAEPPLGAYAPCARCSASLVDALACAPTTVARAPDGTWHTDPSVISSEPMSFSFVRTLEGWAWQGPIAAAVCLPLLKRLKGGGGGGGSGCWYCADKFRIAVHDGLCFPRPPFRFMVCRTDPVASLKELLCHEYGLLPAQVALLHNGESALGRAGASSKVTMEGLGLHDGATLLLTREVGVPAPPPGAPLPARRGMVDIVEKSHGVALLGTLLLHATAESATEAFRVASGKPPAQKLGAAAPLAALAAADARRGGEVGDGEGCRECREASDAALIVCDLCNAEFHMACLKPPLGEAPEGAWYCAECAGVPAASAAYVASAAAARAAAAAATAAAAAAAAAAKKQSKREKGGEREGSDSGAAVESEEELGDGMGCRVCGEEERLQEVVGEGGARYWKPVQGVLLLCDACDAEFHLHCLALKAPPVGSWFCSACVAAGISDPASAATAKKKKRKAAPRGSGGGGAAAASSRPPPPPAAPGPPPLSAAAAKRREAALAPFDGTLFLPKAIVDFGGCTWVANWHSVEGHGEARKVEVEWLEPPYKGKRQWVKFTDVTFMAKAGMAMEVGRPRRGGGGAASPPVPLPVRLGKKRGRDGGGGEGASGGGGAAASTSVAATAVAEAPASIEATEVELVEEEEEEEEDGGGGGAEKEAVPAAGEGERTQRDEFVV
jgi:hypothetical protein